MGLSCTVSEINGPSKIANFPKPRVFWAAAEGVSEVGIGAGVKKTRMMGLPDGRKSFKIGLTV